MILILSFLLLATFASGQRAGPPAYPVANEIPIISYVNENNYDGSYKFSYETGNGISVQEEGALKNAGQPDLEAQTARGSYTYTSPEGQVITVTWYADETGFHSQGGLAGQGAVPRRPRAELSPQQASNLEKK